MIEFWDLLDYRIPGEDKVRKAGEFKLLEPGQVPEGFVVSSFTGDKVYQFFDHGDRSFINHPEPIATKISEYRKGAKAFIKHLSENGGKAVLSRVKAVPLPKNRDDFFDALCDAYPNAFVYSFFSKLTGSWVGATPETLITSVDGVGTTMALAGTRRTDEELPWTEKEFEEHELVADFIQNNLEGVKIQNILRSDRKEKVSGPVRHLLTEFMFDLPQGKAWELAQKLHPTPAVSGWPVKDALKLIADNERHDRRFYAGIIGLVGEETKLYVNLRCAEYGHNKLYLYLGGGFTKDSDPEAEWEETENKAATLINVLKNG